MERPGGMTKGQLAVTLADRSRRRKRETIKQEHDCRIKAGTYLRRGPVLEAQHGSGVTGLTV